MIIQVDTDNLSIRECEDLILAFIQIKQNFENLQEEEFCSYMNRKDIELVYLKDFEKKEI